jgi:UDP-N-acetyl-D-galactosamine dehydrogenase
MNKYKICILGLGYIGLPLLYEFSKYFSCIGYDINITRINELLKLHDSSNELTTIQLKRLLKKVHITSTLKEISESNFFIVTVPTPVNKNNLPDLTMIKNATYLLASNLKKNDFVVYESTVYPTVTESICVPILEKISGLKLNLDFYIGYSPERANPGDKINNLTNITKIVSGSSDFALKEISNVYSKIIKSGLYEAENIKIAESAKIIENIQRDINIALINEFKIIFDKMNIDISKVLDAASTKWNFHSYTPGMVGGHCIGIDPYYLKYYAKKFLKIKTPMITSGRKVNDSMSLYYANQFINQLLDKGINLNKSKILILGFTFKSNCPDIRNTKVYDLYCHLKKRISNIYIHDPFVNSNDLQNTYKITQNTKMIFRQKYDGIFMAVKHDNFKSNINTYLSLLKKKSIFYKIY